MLRRRSVTAYLILLCVVSTVQAINYTLCIDQTRSGIFNGTRYPNGTLYPNGGALDSYGRPALNQSLATAIPYLLCEEKCGSSPEPFDWTIFSTNFSAWLLPWLALVSQLPFGSQLRHHNALSVFLTIGSPALAAYSLIICALNWFWAPRAFEGIRYPNIEYAWRILGSLQHSPLHIDDDSELLASLVTLPENDQWWECLARGLDYEETWTTAIIFQTAWVVVAFALTVVDSFQNGLGNDFKSSGRGTGTLFLWILALVIGWQRLSPRCDFVRVRDALQRANETVYTISDSLSEVVKTPLSRREPTPFLSVQPQLVDIVSSPRRRPGPETSTGPSVRKCRTRFPFALMHYDDDRSASAPIYSDSRLLPWTMNVELVAGAFHAAAEVMASRNLDPNDRRARRSVHHDVEHRIHQSVRPLDWRTIIRRVSFAVVLATMLHWGTVGSAVVYSWLTPTSGLGCRSGSFLLYAAVGHIAWIAIVSSSFLNHYAQWLEQLRQTEPRESTSKHWHPSPGMIRMTVTFLRVSGKVLASLNAIFIVVACIFLFSNFYSRCWCDSSVLGRGRDSFNVIAPTDDDTKQLKTGFIAAIVMSLASLVIFIGFVYMHVDPAPPDPNMLQAEAPEEHARKRRRSLRETLGQSPPARTLNPYSPRHIESFSDVRRSSVSSSESSYSTITSSQESSSSTKVVPISQPSQLHAQ
ncbi:unnamed protein product [Peniophora sp. CBMAI 1063]|nr:unnamed protein product [Peniophora sp. CBMAI 1063]